METETLEAILQNQDEQMSDANDTLTKILIQTADNNSDDLFEKQLLLQDETIQAIKDLKDTINSKQNEPIEIKFEIVGGEASIIEMEEDKETDDEEDN